MGKIKGKNSWIGTDSENYTAQLFGMKVSKDHEFRPDLLTTAINNALLTIELKSGKANKGVVSDYQLYYAITTEQDYKEFFGEKIPKGNHNSKNGKMLFDLNAARQYPAVKTPVAFYYAILNRPDDIKNNDLHCNLSTIQLQWGNHYLVPHEFIFYTFVIQRVKRTGEKFYDALDKVKKIIQLDVLKQYLSPKEVAILEENAGYSLKERKRDKQSWQNIFANDILAIFKKDRSLTSSCGRKRLNKLEFHIPQLKDVKRIEIPGPNGNSIYILAKPEDEKIFNVQLRNNVEAKLEYLEGVKEERADAEEILFEEIIRIKKSLSKKEIKLFQQDKDHFLNTRQKSKIFIRRMNPKIKRKLEALVRWESAKAVPSKTNILQETSTNS